MTILTRSCALLLLGILPATAPAAVYKWVDENGQVQYTQTPPPGDIEATELKPPPEPADQAGTIERVEAREKGLEERRESREQSAKEAADDAEYEKQKAQRCEAAKRRLEQLQYPRTNLVDPDGTERRATEEERLEKLREAEGQVKDFCG